MPAGRPAARLTAYAESALPVVAGGPAPPVTFRSLTDTTGVLPWLRALEAGDAAGHPIRAAAFLLRGLVEAAVTLTVAPMVVDGVAVHAPSDRLGLWIDANGWPERLWISEASTRGGPQGGAARLAGARVGALLLPVAGAVHLVGGLGMRASIRLLSDGLDEALRTLSRHRPRHLARGWEEQVAEGAGLEPPGAVRHLVVPVDGRAVRLTARRTCCAPGSARDPDAWCPTCPRHGDDAVRARRAREWIATLDADRYREVTGRER